jgi:hypothetical protein
MPLADTVVPCTLGSIGGNGMGSRAKNCAALARQQRKHEEPYQKPDIISKRRLPWAKQSTKL